MRQKEINIKIAELEKELDGIFSILKSNFSMSVVGFEIHLLRLIFLKRINDIKIDLGYSNFWRTTRNNIAHQNSVIISDIIKLDLYGYLQKVFSKTSYSILLIETIIESFEVFSEKSQSEYTLMQLFMYLDKINLSEKEVPVSVMGNLYRRLIDKYITKDYGFIVTSRYISELMSKILDIHKYETVYDPTIGTGNLVIGVIENISKTYELDGINEVQIYGQEKNNYIYSLCIMNMIMNGINKIDINSNDSFKIHEDISNKSLYKFDKIISHMPIILNGRQNYEQIRIDSANKYSVGVTSNNSEFIEHIVSCMKQKGKAVILVNSDNFYIASREMIIRKSLIEEDLIDTIIFLPPEAIKGAIETSILVINKDKDKDKKNKVLLINLRDKNLIEINKIIDDIYIDEIIELYDNNNNDNDFFRLVEYSKIKKNEYNLSIFRYDSIFVEMEKMLKTGEGRKVEDIADIILGINIAKKTKSENGIPVITAKSLNSNIEEARINFENVEYITPQLNDKIVNTKAIIVNLYGDGLKPTIFYPGDSGVNEIILNRELLAIIPKENIIDLEYMYYKLYSSDVIKQCNGLKGPGKIRFSPVGRISKSSFSQIVILTPSIEIQKQQVIIQKNNLMEIEKIRYHNKIRTINNQETMYDAEESIIRVLVHNILPDITAAKMALNRIQKYLERNNLLREPIEERYIEDDFFDFDDTDVKIDETVENVFSTVNRYIRTFEGTLVKTKETVQLKLEEKDFEIVNIKILLNEIKELKSSEIVDKYEIIIESPDIFISIAQGAFCAMIKNLLRNAEMHGFDFDIKKKYKAEFKVNEEEECIVIIYSNNGRPFTLAKEDYIGLGKKSRNSIGFGLGGAYIDRVIKAHDGHFNIIPWKDGTKMEIVLPKKRRGVLVD